MDRADLLSRVVNDIGPLLTSVGIGLTDTGGAMKEPIDKALEIRGYAEADWPAPTIDAGDNRALVVLTRAYALEKAAIIAAGQIDSEIDAPRSALKGSQRSGPIAKMAAAAMAEAAQYIPADTTAGGMSVGTIDLNYIAESDEEWTL